MVEWMPGARLTRELGLAALDLSAPLPPFPPGDLLTISHLVLHTCKRLLYQLPFDCSLTAWLRHLPSCPHLRYDTPPQAPPRAFSPFARALGTASRGGLLSTAVVLPSSAMLGHGVPALPGLPYHRGVRTPLLRLRCSASAWRAAQWLLRLTIISFAHCLFASVCSAAALGPTCSFSVISGPSDSPFQTPVL